MKEYDHISIYQKILDINDIIDKSLFSLKFNDTELEKEYENFLIHNKSNSKLVLHLIFSVVLIIRMFLSRISSLNKSLYYIFVTIEIIWIIIFLVHFFTKNVRIKKHLNCALSVMIGVINAYSVILINYFEKDFDGSQVREFYIMLLFAFSEILFSYDVNFKLFLIFFCLNLGASIFVMIIKLTTDAQRYKDIISSILVTLASYISKRYSSILQRENYIQNYKLNKYFSYCFDLINNMNGLQFTIKNDRIMLYNQNFKKFVNKSHLMQNIDKNLDKIYFLHNEYFSPEKNLETKADDKVKPRNSNEIEDREKDDFPICNAKLKDMQRGFENCLNKSSIDSLEIHKAKQSKFSKFRIQQNILNDVLKKDKSKSSIDIFVHQKEEVNINMNELENNELSLNSKLDKRIEEQMNLRIDIGGNEKNLTENENKNSYINGLESSLSIFSESKGKNKENLKIINNQKKNKGFDFLKSLFSFCKKNEVKSNSAMMIENSRLIHNNNNSSFLNSNNSIFSNFVNEIGEMYLSSISKIYLSKEFSDFKGENLFEVYKYIQKNYKPTKEIEKFEFLGDFHLKEDNKFFQVFFRKHAGFTDLSDFLIYDLTEIQEAKEIEFNLKSKFFAKIAHEFKTPINSIIGLSKNLNLFASEIKRNRKDDYNKTLSQIENLSNYVVFLINDIIDYSNLYTSKHEQNKHVDIEKSMNHENISQNMGSKLEVQKQNLNLKIDSVNLEQITNFCSDVSETLIINKSKEKYVKIINDYDEQINCLEVLSDEFRLKQILLNFISNSVKFTKSGMIKIKSELIPIEIQKEKATTEDSVNSDTNTFNSYEIKISIIDTGIGIRQNDLNSLLEYKDNNMISSSMNYNKEGSGLGLSITKYISDLLNHRIEVSSTYGKGSCFSVVIKARLVNPEKLMIKKTSKNRLKISNQNHNKNDQLSERLNKFKMIKDSIYKYGLKIDELRNQFTYNNEKRKILIDDNSNLSQITNSNRTKHRNQNYNKNGFLNLDTILKISNRKSDSKSHDENKSLNCSFEINNNKEMRSENISNATRVLDENDFYLSIDYLIKGKNKPKKFSHNDIVSFNKSYSDLDKNSFSKNSNGIRFSNIIKNIRVNFKSYDSSEKSSDKISKHLNNKIVENLDNEKEIAKTSKEIYSSTKNKLDNLFSIENLNRQSKFQTIYNSSSYTLRNGKEKNSNLNTSSEINFLKKANENSSINENLDNKKLILIVDDHKFVRESLKNIINKIIKNLNISNFFEVKEAQDGADIISLVVNDQCQNNRIKCVITDENMEYINGSEAVKIIRDLEHKNKIKPIIIASITSFEDNIMKNLIKTTGVNYFLPKPCNEVSIKKFFEEFKIFEMEHNIFS